VASEPPLPPQVSPDGRFYWDGQRWVPMPTDTPNQPLYAHEIRRQYRRALGCSAVIGMILGLFSGLLTVGPKLVS